jgi:Spy/CpxP family protein refolding chaperone
MNKHFMNKIILSLIIAAAIPTTFTSQAQVATPIQPAPAPHPGDQYMSVLQITTAQKAQMQAAMEDKQEKGLALLRDKSLTPEQRRVKVQALRDEFMAKIKTFLTVDQFAKYQQLSATAQRANGGVHEPISNRLNQLAVELNLTDAQKSQIQSAMQEQVDKSIALVNDKSLATEQRSAKLVSLRDEFQAKLKAILTPEQFAKIAANLAATAPRTRPQPRVLNPPQPTGQ